MVRIRHAILADADALARIMIEANQDAFRGLVPEQCLNWITPQESADNWRRTIAPGGMRDGDCLFVAETAAKVVVGFALARAPQPPADVHAELRVIAVLPAFQRRGIGGRLVRACAEHLRKFGVTSMIVRVMSVNPHRTFYEGLGARFVRAQPMDWNGVLMPQSVYEWTDLSRLLAPEL